MKYQSELIKEIVESRGHKMSSIHYESECIESWIEEAKGAYPKLCDYESEWLNYISVLDDKGGSEEPEPPIGEFPYIVLSDVTETTIDNVVPYAYKSANLKGNTLVNLLNKLTVNGEVGQPTNWYTTTYTTGTVKSGTYILLYHVKETSGTTSRNTPGIRLADGTYLYHGYDDFNTTTGIKKWIFTANEDLTEFGYWLTNNTGKVVVEDFILLEYQEGMENWDIPYFEGMQTVKAPVLTTSNGDGTKSNILTVNEPVELRGIGEVKDELNLLTGEYVRRIGEDVLDGSSDEKYIKSGLVLSDTIVFGIVLSDMKLEGASINNKFITSAVDDNRNYEHSYSSKSGNENLVWFFINKEKLSSLDISGFRQWLSQNPLTIQYELATESVKTVELNIQDQDGKTLSKIKPIEGTMVLSTSSDTINPFFSGEIPVEAITQNLASFIDLETEE